MEKEIWKDINGYEGYQISNWGRVKSLNYKRTGKEQIMLPFKKKGYLYINLSKNKKKVGCRINRLVALTFIPIPEHLKDIPIEKLDVGHLKPLPDGTEDKTANEVWNLAWMSKSENHKYGTIGQRISISKKGYKCSEETKEVLSQKNRNNTKASKPVLQIDKETNEVIAEFPSTREIKRQFGYDNSHISACCRGKLKSSYGYIWKYAY